MNDIKDIVTKPIFFERNRVYRIFLTLTKSTI